MDFLARLYAKRIVNVNVNIIVAGLLAMLLTLIPVHLSYNFTHNNWYILGITFFSDLVFDVVIYYALHWLANHMPWRHTFGLDNPEVTRPAVFFRDATIVQGQRAVLSPVLYSIFLGLQWHLLTLGVAREWSAVVGLTSGILCTRVLHTIWMLASARQGAKGSDTRRIDPDIPASRESTSITHPSRPAVPDPTHIEGAA